MDGDGDGGDDGDDGEIVSRLLYPAILSDLNVLFGQIRGFYFQNFTTALFMKKLLLQQL